MIFKSILKVVILLSLLYTPLFSEAKNSPELKPDVYYAGWSSLLPGLGQVKKDRLYSGIFFFSLFAASAINWQKKLQEFNQAENDYKSKIVFINLISISSPQSSSSANISSGLFSYILLGQQAFRPYQIASDHSNLALSYVVAIYFVQIMHAFFCSPGDSFQVKNESKQSYLNFNISPTRNQFGQTGTNVDLSYTWRF